MESRCKSATKDLICTEAGAFLSGEATFSSTSQPAGCSHLHHPSTCLPWAGPPLSSSLPSAGKLQPKGRASSQQIHKTGGGPHMTLDHILAPICM